VRLATIKGRGQMSQSTRRQFVEHVGEGALAVSVAQPIFDVLGRRRASPAVRITDVKSLRHTVQMAVELEHATIPPYLCALFSIVPGSNEEVAGLSAAS
jgi:hypothetical protein